MAMMAPPGILDVTAAARRIADAVVTTPLLESDLLNAEVGGRVLVKAEVLQRTGSFKFRGAYNRLKRLSPQQRETGVVAYSSGNHAQGIAAARIVFGDTLDKPRHLARLSRADLYLDTGRVNAHTSAKCCGIA